ncbi:hypothetical protein BESB_055690 [Besnoitia besnoiti]|uniref:Folate receptor-like domain-containing protein n=1 Tax=Besnoitia besnoiti TaxID=94643 RepID=A0A2A9MBR2_BESBE|nr:hypothetical protein BESB_055690 [Besnoitia besnoiti]PFH35918.1 hypothetical protein BESB_055690 [Besnoitia besnoiti]
MKGGDASALLLRMRSSSREAWRKSLLVFLLVGLLFIHVCAEEVERENEKTNGTYSQVKTSREREAESKKYSSQGVCLPSMGFSVDIPRDRRDDVFLACHEHQGNTCCQRRDTEHVLRRLSFYYGMEKVKKGFSFPPRDCPSFTSAAMCARCDARVGLGKMTRRNAPLLCRSFCDTWFRACFDDYFAPAPSGSPQALTVCSPDSVICSPLRDVTSDGASFCRKLGFEVAGGSSGEEGTDEEENEEDDATPCYDGVPAASALGAAPKPPPPADDAGSGYPARWTWRERLWYLRYRLALYLSQMIPRTEFWLFLLLLFYFLSKALRAVRELVSRALFRPRHVGSQPWGQGCHASLDAADGGRSGDEEEEVYDEGEDADGRGAGGGAAPEAAEASVRPPAWRPLEGKKATPGERAADAAAQRWAQQRSAGGRGVQKAGFAAPTCSLFGGRRQEDDEEEEEVMNPEEVREVLAAVGR